MATYEMNYGEIRKQQGEISNQLDALGKALTEMQSIENDCLTAGQYSAADREEVMSRFEAYIGSGQQLRSTGSSHLESLDQVATTYQQAEQH